MLFTKEGVSALHAWTHERLDTVFQHVRVLTASQFIQQTPGFGQPSVRDQLVHILAAESGWIRRLQKLTSENWGLISSADLPALLAAKRHVASATQTYLQTLDEVQLNKLWRQFQKIGSARRAALDLFCYTSTRTPSITKGRSLRCAASWDIHRRTLTCNVEQPSQL
jgi:uncharacterized damage-inducible protein DinB